MIKKEKFSDKYKLAIKLIPVMVVALIVGALLARFLYTKQQDAHAKAESESRLEKKLDEKLTRLKDVKDTWDQRASDRQFVEKAMPSHSAYPQASVMLENISAKAGTQINSMNFSPGTSQGAASGVLASISVSGKYPQAIDFIKNLEKSARVIRVNSIGIGGGDDVELVVNLHLYWQPEAKVSNGN